MPGFLAGSIFVTRKKKKEKPKRHAEVLETAQMGYIAKIVKMKTSLQKASLIGADEWPLGLVHDVVFH